MEVVESQEQFLLELETKLDQVIKWGTKTKERLKQAEEEKKILLGCFQTNLDVKVYLETECEKAVNEIIRLTTMLDRMADELDENKKMSFAMKMRMESNSKYDDQSQANFYLSERLKECQNELAVQQKANSNLVYTVKELKSKQDILENERVRFKELERESEIDKKYILQLENELSILKGQIKRSSITSELSSRYNSQQDINNTVYPEKIPKYLVEPRFNSQNELEPKEVLKSGRKDSVIQELQNNLQKVENKDLYKIIESENSMSEKVLATIDVGKNRRLSIERNAKYENDDIHSSQIAAPKQRPKSPSRAGGLLNPTPVYSSHIHLRENSLEKKKYYSVGDQINNSTVVRQNSNSSVTSVTSDSPGRKKSISQIPLNRKRSSSNTKNVAHKTSATSNEQPSFLKNEVLKSQTMLNDLDDQIRGLADMKT
ncbi:hypothetical protein HDV06_006913 [Boothiomyces sp. JEL0866]|nr:hypothetical protein HDV06_006913 [Boothiomyces sp. JEL0866]